MGRLGICLVALMLGASAASLAFGQSAAKKYGPGVTDTSIKLGQTMAYSGPAAVFGAVAKAEAAYFQMINDQGGVNGRKIELISLDDGYQPAKALEVTKQLVEQEKVLAIVGSLGGQTGVAVRDYLNANKVPQLFVGAPWSEFGDPARFRWTMGFQPPFLVEARIYGRYIRQTMPNAKIAVLHQNDHAGRDYLQGLTSGLGDDAGMIVSVTTYEPLDSNVDAQVKTMQASGATVFLNFAAPRPALAALQKARELDWKPTLFIGAISNSLQFMKLAGRAGRDAISASYIKEPADKLWADDRGRQDWDRWMRLYNRSGNVKDGLNVYGYLLAMTTVQVLQQCGDDLTRENVMKQAANLKSLALPMLLPGIVIDTSPTDYFPIQQMQLQKWDGDDWVLFGGVIDGG